MEIDALVGVVQELGLLTGVATPTVDVMLALVKGRVETSGPILRRAGFTAYGDERCYRWPA